MKVIALIIVHCGQVACSAFQLDSFGYFQRGKVKEWAIFFSKTLLSNTPVGTRQDVRHEEFMCHLYNRTADLGMCSITDVEYNQRVAFTLMNKALDEFIGACTSILERGQIVKSYPYQGLEELIVSYQNPVEVDTIAKVQVELDDTKITLHNTIESVLERGQRLDQLIEKSEDLSMASKMFYKTARKQNRCCCIQ